MSLIGELAAVQTDRHRFPNLDAWVRRFQGRSAYRAAIRRGGPYDLEHG
jgi:glutathione S-transferase